eukprot:m.187993 g.187993  ORF g.187993 m.187993 type:complete len:117 (-) comp32325_c1_seq6:164-514(-)
MYRLNHHHHSHLCDEHWRWCFQASVMPHDQGTYTSADPEYDVATNVVSAEQQRLSGFNTPQYDIAAKVVSAERSSSNEDGDAEYDVATNVVFAEQQRLSASDTPQYDIANAASDPF